MSFYDEVRSFVEQTGDTQHGVFIGYLAALHESVQIGSAITGSPGQPVDLGNLRNSWQISLPEENVGLVSTNVQYAVPVEDGVGPHGPVKYGKSGVGGSHSVKLTIAAADRLLRHVILQVTGRVQRAL